MRPALLPDGIIPAWKEIAHYHAALREASSVSTNHRPETENHQGHVSILGPTFSAASANDPQ